MDLFLSETINQFQLTDSGRGMKSPANHSLMTMPTHQMIMEIGKYWAKALLLVMVLVTASCIAAWLLMPLKQGCFKARNLAA
jgi:hypothetical protein